MYAIGVFCTIRNTNVNVHHVLKISKALKETLTHFIHLLKFFSNMPSLIIGCLVT